MPDRQLLTQASNLLDRGREGVRSLQDQGRSAADGVRGGAEYAITQTREVTARSVSYVQDQPLLLGALGIALGAGLGMLVPTSRHEREMLREASAGLREQAKGAVRELQAGASRVAQAAVGTAQDAAQREGLHDCTRRAWPPRPANWWPIRPAGCVVPSRRLPLPDARRSSASYRPRSPATRATRSSEAEPKMPSAPDVTDPVTLDNKVKPLPLP